MAQWLYHVRLRSLMTELEDWDSVQASMNAIAKVLETSPCFRGFSVKQFRAIPKGDDVIGPVDYANRLIDRMYDFADQNRIWID